MQQQRFGKYTLLRRIGSGGMAEVFLARTVGVGGFEKILAVKRLLPCYSQDKQTIQLLADEARLTVQLTHPNIVQVFDFSRVEDSYYIAMEYVDGLDLKSLVAIEEKKSQPLPLDAALNTTISILDALHFAHTKTDANGSPLGIIHRDVSPHNVLISRHGQVKLADFGVARAAISSHVSHVGDIKGKFSYMPPEQIGGEPIDQRVDIFATGVVLYELLSGVPLYHASTLGEQLQMLKCKVDPPSSFGRKLPPELDTICLTALAKEKEQRFASAEEFAQRLRRLSLKLFSSKIPSSNSLSEIVETRLVLTHTYTSHAENSGVMSFDDFAMPEGSLIAADLQHAQQQILETVAAKRSVMREKTKDIIQVPQDSQSSFQSELETKRMPSLFLSAHTEEELDQSLIEVKTDQDLEPTNVDARPLSAFEKPLRAGKEQKASKSKKSGERRRSKRSSSPGIERATPAKSAGRMDASDPSLDMVKEFPIAQLKGSSGRSRPLANGSPSAELLPKSSAYQSRVQLAMALALLLAFALGLVLAILLIAL